MDPTLSQTSFDPPREPVLRRGLLPALVLNGLLLGAFAWGLEWDWNAGDLARRAAGPLQQAAAKMNAGRQAAKEAPGDRREPPPQALQGTPAPAAQSVPHVQTAAAVQVRTVCPIGPQLAARTTADGQLLPPASVQGRPASEAVALLTSGQAAAAAGRTRDAEVSFLTACRIADATQGRNSVAAADARHQMARHYAQSAVALGPGERTRLLRWSQAFQADAEQVYRAQLGDSHAKTRLARQDLQDVRQAVAAAPARAADAATMPAPAASNTRVAMGAARAADPPRPSFDCSKARSVTEKLICADPDLARQDRELGRLHAQARAAAPDAAVFRRASDAAWQRREATCRDRACLQQWYAQRRQELSRAAGR